MGRIRVFWFATFSGLYKDLSLLLAKLGICSTSELVTFGFAAPPSFVFRFKNKKQKTKQYRGIDHELSGNPIPEIHAHQSDLPDAAYIVHKFLKPTYSFSPSSTSNHILAPRSPREQPPNCTQQFH